ncbi:uncharacterized protein YuzB (UPF0349 family) [Bacillus ectoiniformans]|uniref:DUF1450 domain-containing protein n=1 Tax=Bacillus ectoiniformans TaxID=1494429 RepID=UPI0019565C4A|nr:DUF1450 domain-containing protein [Bacillus ectoiniformans]MBM7647371.1 uncharacterized protein YuzB (UPF0349 family) [Bacillus ectoiniformans]
MEIIAKFCPCNFEDELDEVKEKLSQMPNTEVIEERCLNYCGQCLVQPYVLINGENIVADSPEELFMEAEKYIQEIEN